MCCFANFLLIFSYFNAAIVLWNGKNSFYNSLQASSDLNTALDSCADNLLKTSLDDFALPPVPKKDLLSSLNNNVDYFNPNFTNCT